MTSGYVDYVIGNTEFEEALYKDPFRAWEPDQHLGFATSKPLLYEPGTNWNYAHTNYVLLGRALEKATGQQMPELLRDKVLRPLGLSNTANSFTPQIPAPVLHAFPERTPTGAENTNWHSLLRGVHVLESILDHHPRRNPDDDVYDMAASASGLAPAGC
jgi:CubicO group peptidase (beta-lactamase class C family)